MNALFHPERLPSPRNARRALAVGLALSAAALAGCSGRSYEYFSPGSAVVYAHEFEPEHVAPVLIGKIWSVATVEDKYTITLEQCGHDNAANADPAGCILNTKEVDKVLYDAYPVGTTVTVAKDDSWS